jgi:hypothetical protein
MHVSSEEEARLIRYILDDLPQDERERIEERYFQDDSYFEMLTGLEVQLVHDWVAGSLTPKQAAQFEKWMDGDAALREHVAVVEALAGGKRPPAGGKTGPAGVLRYFLFLREAPGWLAFAGCAFLAAAAVTMTFSYLRIGRLQEQMATLMAVRRPVAAPQASTASDPAFSLLAGIPRGAAGRTSVLTIPAGAQLVHLQVIVPGRQADTLRMALRDPDNGAQSWSAFVGGGRQVEVAVPAGLLGPGDHVLTAETAAGEAIESWQFRVVR